MITITRKRLKGKEKVEHKIYTMEDVENGAFTEPFVYWKDLKAGTEYKWAAGDDGYIGEVLKINEYRVNRYSKAKNTFVRLSYGNSFIRKNTKMLFEERQSNNSWSYVKPEHWTEKLAKRDRIKKIARAVALMYMNGRIDYAKIGKMYRPDHKIPEASARRLLKIEKVKGMVMSEIESILEEKGLSKAFVAESAKKMIDLAISGGDLKSGGKLIEIVGKWLAMEAPKVKETHQEENSLLLARISDTIAEAKQIKTHTMEGRILSERTENFGREIDGINNGVGGSDGSGKSQLRISQGNSANSKQSVPSVSEPKDDQQAGQ